MVSASQQRVSPKDLCLQQFVTESNMGGHTTSGIASSDFLFFSNKKIQLTGLFHGTVPAVGQVVSPVCKLKKGLL